MAQIQLPVIQSRRSKAPGLDLAEANKFPQAIRNAVLEDKRITPYEMAMADYVEFNKKHPKFKPAYNAAYLKKDQLEKQKLAGKIRYEWNEQDYDGDGQNDILVWDKKGLKAFNGNIMKKGTYKPDYDYYTTHLTKAERENQGYEQYYNTEYEIPAPVYDNMGNMTNSEEYNPKFKELKQAYEGYRIPKMKKKVKTLSIRQFFVETLIKPIVNICKQYGIKVHLPLYQRIINDTYLPFILDNVADEQKALLTSYFNKELPGQQLNSTKEQRHDVYVITKQLAAATPQFKQVIVTNSSNLLRFCIDKIVGILGLDEDAKAAIEDYFRQTSTPSSPQRTQE